MLSLLKKQLVFTTVLAFLFGLSMEGTALMGLDADANPDAAPEANADDKAFTPTFKKTRKAQKASFEKGLEYYKKKEYKQAQKNFKRSASGTATKDDKTIVNKWIAACIGGIALEKYKVLAKKGSKSKTFFAVLDESQKFVGTPIYKGYRNLINDLQGEVVYEIDDFEIQDNKLSERYGKKYFLNAKDAYNGRNYLKWAQNPKKDAHQLRFKKAPKSFVHYDSIVFWVRCRVQTELQVAVRCKGKTGQQINAYMKKVKLLKTRGNAWSRIQVSTKEMRPYGKPNWSQIENIFLQMPDKKNFDVDLDFFCLVKKEVKVKPRR